MNVFVATRIKKCHLMCSGKWAMHAVAVLSLMAALTAECYAVPSDLTMADNPLESGTAPEPNILIVADDSGSMDWELVVEQDAASKENSLDGVVIDGSFFPYSNLFGYSPFYFDYFDNKHPNNVWAGRVAPTLKAVMDQGSSYEYRDLLAGIWRVRNPQYNLIYYNPEVRYDPWPGYSPAAPNAAWPDPNNPDRTVMLTRNANANLTNNMTVTFPSSTSADGARNVSLAVYLPFYYTWQPADAEDQYIDANECGQLIEIKVNALMRDCYGHPVGGPIFPMAKGPERTDCADPATCTAAEELQNFANWFSYYRRREFIAKAGLSRVVTTLSDVRLGYVTINGDRYEESRRPRYPITDQTDTQELLSHIYKTEASTGGTPLLTALDGAGKYFACQSGSSMGSHSCPATYSSARACQRNYTVLITDGFWDAESDLWRGEDTGAGRVETVVTTLPALNDHDSDTSSPFSGGIFADNNRSGAATEQWLTLADVAMYYFKTDLDPDAPNEVMPSRIEKTRMADPSYWDRNPTMHQHMTTFTLGFGLFNNSQNSIGQMGSNGQWIPPAMTDSVTWPRLSKSIFDTNKLEDLKHTAFNGRGMFFSATGIKSLVKNLQEAFTSIRNGAGAVAAVSFSTQQLEAGSVVYTASFDATNSSGDLVAYNIDPATGLISTEPNNVVWRAAERLARKITDSCDAAADTRTLLSSVRNSGVTAGIEFSAVPDYLTDAQAAWFRGHQYSEFSSGCSTSAGLRDRDRPQGLLGDIVHSRPIFVGKPSFKRRDYETYPSGDDSYRAFQQRDAIVSRADMVMVGANDGLFHVFNAANGDEVFAYAPGRLVQGGNKNSRLSDVTSATYGHQYYVDLSPAVNDVYIKPGTVGDRAWNTVVIGGFRAGGRGYFALNVTNPSAFGSEATGKAKVMWEFSDLDDGGLGLTFSPPLLAMTNEPHSDTADGNKWRAVFGNGYNSDDGIARLFLLDIEGGYDGWQRDDNYAVIDASDSPAAEGVKNGLGIPRAIDIDDNGTIDYAYAGDLEGNLYRFDLTSTVGEFTSSKIFTAQSAAGVRQSITTQPLVVRHPEDHTKYIVVFTTGSWMTREDGGSTEIQSVYAVSDAPADATSPTPYVRDALTPRRLKNVDVGGATMRVIVGDAMEWSEDIKGWYMDFDARAAGISPDDVQYDSSPVIRPGERAIRNMVMRGGYVFVNTVFPSGSQSCSAALGGAVMAFNPVTGLLDKAIFDFNDDGNFDTSFDENIAGLITNTSLSNSAMIGDRLVFQEADATGEVSPRSIKTNTNQETIKGRLSWLEIR